MTRSTSLVLIASLGLLLCGSCGRFPKTTPSETVQATPLAEQPEGVVGYKVQWISNDAPRSMTAGNTAPVHIRFKNVSTTVWPDNKAANPQATGAQAVRLSYRWWGPSDVTPVIDYAVRADLPHPLGPQEEISLTIEVTAPEEPGEYRLQFDLVHELVSWFESQGAPRLVVPVSVSAQ